jgi:hypothetical protein
MGLTHHDGISLYGSGLYMGAKNLETIFATNVSGYDVGLPRVDMGIVGTSGHQLSVSTRLSSIGIVVTQYIDVLAPATTGMITTVTFSGNAFDMYKYTVTGSAATSSRVAWMAVGI